MEVHLVEKYEIRVFSKYLSLLGLSAPVDRYIIAVPLRGIVGDSLFDRIRTLAQYLQKDALPSPFGSWDIIRTYTPEETQQARLFFLRLPLTHLAAEEYGTKYDESSTCLQCGLGSKQIGTLQVPERKLPSARDIIQLWGGELLVSENLASVIRNEH